MFLDFFKKEAVGLDISDYSIEIISLGGSIKNPKLISMGRIILEAGVVEDGKILNKEKLVDSLKKLLENLQFGKIKTKKFIFSLSESKSFIYIFELPKNLKKKEELEYIKSQVEQNFPYSLKELYFDFQIRGDEVLLVAASKEIVNDYLEVFKDCQLQPKALEIESESLARVLISDAKEPILIVDIGARTTNFSIFDEMGLRLSISIPIAGNKFTQALSEKLKISFEEAENLKKEIGLNPKPRGGKVFLILQNEIQEIIQEIRKIEDYFQEKSQKNIKKIILAGGSSQLPCLSEYLAENVEKEVVIADPLVKINIDILKKKEYFKKAIEINPILYSTVIGSALRGLAKDPKKAGINLLRQS